MKDRAIVLFTAAVVVFLSGAAWLFLPVLQSSERKLEARVGESAERARRMVAQFNAQTDASAEFVDRAGITADLSAERVGAIIASDHRPAQEALEAEATRLQEMLRGSVARTRQLDATFNTLDPGTQLTARSVPAFGNQPDAVQRDLTTGIQQRDRLIADNRARMSNALTEVGRALSDQQGDASGTDSVAANWLKGMALQQEAEAASRSASLHRQTAVGALNDMRTAARAHGAARAATSIVETSDIASAIAAREQALAEARAQRSEVETLVASLESTVADLQRQIDEQAAIATAARARMDALVDRGLEYELPDAAEQFKTAYENAAREYRTAERAEHFLRYGGLENVRIGASGDLLSGEFISTSPGEEIVARRGLEDYAGDLAVARKDLEGLTAEVERAESRVREAEELRTAYERRQDGASARASTLQDRVAARYSAYREAEAAATQAEDLAIRKFTDAAKSFNGAQRAYSARVADVPVGLSPDVLERSPYSLIQRDAWAGAEAKAEAADAELRAALIWHERVRRLEWAEAVLGDVQEVAPLEEHDDAALAERLADARDQGFALAEKATQALESVGRDLENHWTVAASLAAANYVMSLFDRPELRNLAIQNYNAAVQGRENDANVRPFLERMRQIGAEMQPSDAGQPQQQ